MSASGSPGHGRLWALLLLVIFGSLAVLGFFGREVYRQAPPIPERIIVGPAADGLPGATPDVLYTARAIRDGQNVWQSLGGQQLGSIWGHGAYVAPDWSADWLHREALVLADLVAAERHGVPFDQLDEADAAGVQALVRRELRSNTHDRETGDLVVSPRRAQAIRAVAAHYVALFSDDPALRDLRVAYAIAENPLRDPARREDLTAFFFWAAWACVAERPGSTVSYTQNWPPDAFVGNQPTPAIVFWSIISIVALLAGIGWLVWYQSGEPHDPGPTPPASDPLRHLVLTPSMKATLKFFWVVGAMMLVQVGLGVLTAHYGVEGQELFGIPLAEVLPYAVTRTWHTQLGILWIATAWLATGLFLAPAVSGVEPRGQRLLVNVLFACLLVIVVGSMFGQWLGVQQKLGHEVNFWFGHQGYEYVDLGRFWQVFLLAGLFIWLGLMLRELWPALRRRDDSRSLLGLFVLASAAIGMFYAAGLMWGRQTHLALAEYWRWWVVHLWVEGFFEVFATVAIAFLFTRLGLIGLATATRATLISCSIFLFGGILGTFHHLYFTGTPTSILALGATFSALEIVPLVLIGLEAREKIAAGRAAPWVAAYRWPIRFFLAVAFWNLVGAGIFGFLINPPIALYYVQGLNTTPVHGHTALFGVYGMLGIGLMLFCLRAMAPERRWNETPLAVGFWSLNAGLVLMVALSLLPIGLAQAWVSVEHGLWYARSADFLQQPWLQTLRWMRAPGDVVFAVGIVAVVFFVARIGRAWREPAPVGAATDADAPAHSPRRGAPAPSPTWR